MNLKIFTILDVPGRHLGCPSPAMTKKGIAVLYRNSPARKPPTTHDPKGFLEMGMLDIETGKIQKDTIRPVPRFRASGHAPGTCRVADDKLLLVDNLFHLHDWLGERGVSMIAHHNWTVTPLGAHSMILDESGDKMMFGKPRPVAAMDYPVVIGYGPPIALGDSVLYPCDFNTEATVIETKPWETVLMESEDSGASWKVKSMIHLEDETLDIPRLRKPYLVSVDDKTKMTVMLQTEKDSRMFSTFSDDGGATWTTPADSGIEGSWRSLLKLRDGRIALFYIPTYAETSINAITSGDGGKTWDESGKLTIGNMSKIPCVSHIRCVQLDDDSILLACAGSMTNNKERILIGAQFSL